MELNGVHEAGGVIGLPGTVMIEYLRQRDVSVTCDTQGPLVESSSYMT